MCKNKSERFWRIVWVVGLVRKWEDEVGRRRKWDRRREVGLESFWLVSVGEGWVGSGENSIVSRIKLYRIFVSKG